MQYLYKFKFQSTCFNCIYVIKTYIRIIFNYILVVQKNLLMKLPCTRKALVLDLITDDLINTKLVYSLNNLGLQANDYTLHLSTTIMNLMRIKTTSLRWENIHDEYLKMTSRVLKIDIQESPRMLTALAEEIYDFLKLRKEEEKAYRANKRN